MKLQKFIGIGCIIVILSSCDPGSCSQTSIKNNTSSSFNIDLFSTHQGEVNLRTIECGAKGQVNLFFDCGLGMLDPVFPQDLNYDSVSFAFEDNVRHTFQIDDLGKSLFNEDSWTQNTKKKFPAGWNVVTVFEVNEEDLLEWK